MPENCGKIELIRLDSEVMVVTRSKVVAKILESRRGGFDVVFELPSGGEIRYGSVFTERAEALDFAERVNRLDVSEIHIPDIIEDAML